MAFTSASLSVQWWWSCFVHIACGPDDFKCSVRTIVDFIYLFRLEFIVILSLIPSSKVWLLNNSVQCNIVVLINGMNFDNSTENFEFKSQSMVNIIDIFLNSKVLYIFRNSVWKRTSFQNLAMRTLRNIFPLNGSKRFTFTIYSAISVELIVVVCLAYKHP